MELDSLRVSDELAPGCCTMIESPLAIDLRMAWIRCAADRPRRALVRTTLCLSCELPRQRTRATCLLDRERRRKIRKMQDPSKEGRRRWCRSQAPMLS